MVTILDGGMGGEIQKRMDGAGKGLWSAKALMEEPEIVVGLHQELSLIHISEPTRPY